MRDKRATASEPEEKPTMNRFLELHIARVVGVLLDSPCLQLKPYSAAGVFAVAPLRTTGVSAATGICVSP